MIFCVLSPFAASNATFTLKPRLYIALLVLALTANPLLAVNPCQVDCLVSSAQQAGNSMQIAAHHGGHAAHPNQSQEEGKLQILSLTCGSHPAVALQVAAYVAPQPEKVGQVAAPAAVEERSVTTFTPLPFTQSSSNSQLHTGFSSKAVPLRI